MGTRHRVHTMAVGSDRKRQYTNGKYDSGPRTEDELEAAMDVLIHKAHCRLLERGTGGLLTWSGDAIVSTSPSRHRLRKVEEEQTHEDVMAHEDVPADEAEQVEEQFYEQMDEQEMLDASLMMDASC